MSSTVKPIAEFVLRDCAIVMTLGGIRGKYREQLYTYGFDNMHII